jgi:hypothetical protein
MIGSADYSDGSYGEIIELKVNLLHIASAFPGRAAASAKKRAIANTLPKSMHKISFGALCELTSGALPVFSRDKLSLIMSKADSGAGQLLSSSIPETDRDAKIMRPRRAIPNGCCGNRHLQQSRVKWIMEARQALDSRGIGVSRVDDQIVGLWHENRSYRQDSGMTLSKPTVSPGTGHRHPARPVGRQL